MTAAAGNKTSGGGGLAALVILGVAFCWPAKGAKTVSNLGHTKYHVLRFYGADPAPPRTVVESEIERAARAHGLDPRLLRAVVKTESAFNHKAVSRVGARGLGQVMPFHVSTCGLRSVESLFDPVHNLQCSARILAENLRTFNGNIRDAVAAYNAGPTRIGKWIKAGRRPEMLPAETRAYVPTVLARMTG